MKLIFIIQGYDKRSENGNLEEVITLELFAKTEKEALKKAKQIIKKPFYRVSGVVEKDK